MQAPLNQEALQEKWAPLLDYNGLEEIKDPHKRMVTAVLLENQEKALREEREFLAEGPPTVNTNSGANAGFSASASSPTAGFDPVLISLIRRSMPNLVAYDLAGVQPMNGPTGLIFAMRSRYEKQDGNETFYNEVDSAFSGQAEGGGKLTDGFVDGNVGLGTTAQSGSNPGLLGATGTAAQQKIYNVGQGMRTDDAEALGDGVNNNFNQMAFSIEKVTVTAKSRALKAEYSLELAQDLKAIHGLNAEAELANILSTEILAEINREVIRTIYNVAEIGATVNTATSGTFDLDVDSNGRWSVEKFKGLLFQIERDANAIGQETRRGKGNILICSADVASALGMAGVLDYAPGLQGNSALTGVDDTSSTLVGTLNGRIKVYVDPYSSNVADKHFYVAGYKGTSPYDAGLFYCPYVPLQQVRAINPNTFQPKIGFKTRYGMVSNPFSGGLTQGSGALTANANKYYRRVQVANLM